MGAPLRVRALYNREGKRSGDPRGQRPGYGWACFQPNRPLMQR